MKKAMALFVLLGVLFALAGCSREDIEQSVERAVGRIEAGAESLEEKAQDLEDKLSGIPDEEPEETPEPTPEPEPAPAEGPAQEAASDEDIRPEIKEAIDGYEEFFRSYVDFMKNYDTTDISALSEYLSFLEQYTQTWQKLDDMENGDLTDAETVYLAQAMLRIDQMLLEVAS